MGRLGRASVAALTDDVPPLEEINPNACYVRWDVTLETAQPRSAIEDVFIFVMDDMELSIEALAGELVTAVSEAAAAVALAGEAVAVVPAGAAAEQKPAGARVPTRSGFRRSGWMS